MTAEAERLAVSGWFEHRALYVEPLGFMKNTDARRISYEEAQRFGEMHKLIYRRFGFDLAPIEAGTVEERVRRVLAITGA